MAVRRDIDFFFFIFLLVLPVLSASILNFLSLTLLFLRLFPSLLLPLNFFVPPPLSNPFSPPPFPWATTADK